MRRTLTALTLALLCATWTQAADLSPPPAAQANDPLSLARQLIKSKDWPGALAALRASPQPGDADWNNLMGYTLRKQPSPDLALAEKHYLEALRLAPDHRGANEYLGELYVMKGDIASARLRLKVLEKLCPTGCEERADLQRAIDKAAAK